MGGDGMRVCGIEPTMATEAYWAAARDIRALRMGRGLLDAMVDEELQRLKLLLDWAKIPIDEEIARRANGPT